MQDTYLFSNTLAKPKVIVLAASNTGTYPPFAPLSGTFTTSGKTVTFLGVSPNIDIKQGDFLYSVTKTQVIKINELTVTGNNIVGILDEPFVTDVSSPETIRIISEPKYRGITITIQGEATNAIIDGQTITLLADQLTFSLPYFEANGLAPIAYSSGTSTLILLITK